MPAGLVVGRTEQEETAEQTIPTELVGRVARRALMELADMAELTPLIDMAELTPLTELADTALLTELVPELMLVDKDTGLQMAEELLAG